MSSRTRSTAAVWAAMESLETTTRVVDADGNVSESYADVSDLRERAIVHSLTGASKQSRANAIKGQLADVMNKIAHDVMNDEAIAALGINAIKARYRAVSSLLADDYYAIYNGAKSLAKWLVENSRDNEAQSVKANVGNFKRYYRLISVCMAHKPIDCLALMVPNLTKIKNDNLESHSGLHGRFQTMYSEIMDGLDATLVQDRIDLASAQLVVQKIEERIADKQEAQEAAFEFPEAENVPDIVGEISEGVASVLNI